MDVRNLTLTNFVYQGGDDCIALKPRTYDVRIKNVTCHGGNGIAVGSLGQYLEDSSVENVIIDDVKVRYQVSRCTRDALADAEDEKIIRYNEDMHNCAYIKTWIGELAPQNNYESAGQPRGGGWGSVKNITFSNFFIDGADGGPSITQDNGNNGSFAGTSKMDISGISFINFTGQLSKSASVKASVSCSKVHPCGGISFVNVSLTSSAGKVLTTGRCSNISPGGVHGLEGSTCV
jgi:hypothetical protein